MFSVLSCHSCISSWNFQVHWFNLISNSLYATISMEFLKLKIKFSCSTESHKCTSLCSNSTNVHKDVEASGIVFFVTCKTWFTIVSFNIWACSLYPPLTGAIGGFPFHKAGKKWTSVSSSNAITLLKDLKCPSQFSILAAAPVILSRLSKNVCLPFLPLSLAVTSLTFWWTKWHFGWNVIFFILMKACIAVCRMSSRSPGVSPYIFIIVTSASPITKVANSLSCACVPTNCNSGARSPSVSMMTIKSQPSL